MLLSFLGTGEGAANMNVVIAGVAVVALLVAVRLLGGTAIRAFRVFVRGLWPH